MKVNKRKKVMIIIPIFLLFSILSDSFEFQNGKIRAKKEVSIIESKGDGLWGNALKDKIKFKEVLSIGVESGPEYLIFGKSILTSCDSFQNIYIVDIQKHKLIKFDRRGNFLWETGRAGEGPGEFQYPITLIATDNEVIVSEAHRINYFDTKGNFKALYRLEKPIQYIISLVDDKILAALFTSGQPGISAGFFTKEGKFIKKFPFEYKYGPELAPEFGGMSWGGGYFTLCGNKVYLSQHGRYEILEFTIDGQLLKKIRRDIKLRPALVKQTEGGGIFVMDMDKIGPVFCLSNGLFIVNVRLFKKQAFQYNIDFFNRDFKFLGSFQLKKDTELLGIDKFDNFYFVQKYPFTKLIKCVMEIH